MPFRRLLPLKMQELREQRKREGGKGREGGEGEEGGEGGSEMLLRQPLFFQWDLQKDLCRKEVKLFLQILQDNV